MNDQQLSDNYYNAVCYYISDGDPQIEIDIQNECILICNNNIYTIQSWMNIDKPQPTVAQLKQPTFTQLTTYITNASKEKIKRDIKNHLLYKLIEKLYIVSSIDIDATIATLY